MNTALEQLNKELLEADLEFTKAADIEEEGGYSDAMLSMDRAYADGYRDGIALAIRILKEAN
jgi:hypothetical protein